LGSVLAQRFRRLIVSVLLAWIEPYLQAIIHCGIAAFRWSSHASFHVNNCTDKILKNQEEAIDDPTFVRTIKSVRGKPLSLLVTDSGANHKPAVKPECGLAIIILANRQNEKKAVCNERPVPKRSIDGSESLGGRQFAPVDHAPNRYPPNHDHESHGPSRQPMPG